MVEEVENGTEMEVETMEEDTLVVTAEGAVAETLEATSVDNLVLPREARRLLEAKQLPAEVEAVTMEAVSEEPTEEAMVETMVEALEETLTI